MVGVRHRAWVIAAAMVIVVVGVFVGLLIGRERPKVYKSKTAKERVPSAAGGVLAERLSED